MSQIFGRQSLMLALGAILSHPTVERAPPANSLLLGPPEPRGGWPWITNRNSRRRTAASRAKAGPRKRLQRATGPGSYDEWKLELAAEPRAKAAMRRASELTLA